MMPWWMCSPRTAFWRMACLLGFHTKISGGVWVETPSGRKTIHAFGEWCVFCEKPH